MRFKTTIILLIIFILALAGVLLIENKSKAVKEEKEKQDMLTDLKVSDIEKVQLSSSAQTSITITRDEQGNWQIIEPLMTEADSYEVNNLVETLANLRIESVVDNQPADLKEYGFNQQEIKIWLKGQGEPLVILTGLENPLDGTLYAKRADETRVVLLPGYLKNSLDKKLFELRSKEIVKFDPDKVQVIELNSKDIAWKLIKKEENWYFTNPIEALASTSQIDSILSNLSTVKAKNFLAEEKRPEDLKASGLDRPQYTIKLILADGQELVINLNKNEEKALATSSQLAKIVEVETQLINNIARPVSELREKKVALFNSWEATSLAIKKGDKFFEAIKEKSGEKGQEREEWYLLTEAGQKELADSSKVESFLRKLEYLQAVDFIDSPEDSKKYGLDKPEYEITVKAKSEDDKEKIIKLFFGQKLEGKNQLAVRNNDFNYLFLIEASALTDWPAGPEDLKSVEIKS